MAARAYTQDNPADLVSRGLTSHEFLDASIWTNGPQWLSLKENKWPQEIIKLTDIPEMRIIVAYPSFTDINFIDQKLVIFSKEIRSLKNGEHLDHKSRLIPLKPFLDKFGILRVGGRLTH